jgi:tRNA nucleotidyltransferase/poly(A) polymerase
MHDLWNAVSTNRILERILPLLPPSAYLVGGCVRDLLLGRETFDLDLVTFSDVWGLARQIEAILEGKAFWIDRERKVVRVALKRGKLTVDVSPPRGPDIASDLAQRDITINAMAYDTRSAELIDPLNGLSDLREGIIRIISEENLKDDPLRGIRCIRFAVQLDFGIEDKTMNLIRAHAGLIHRVSQERIKQEFLKALSVAEGTLFFRYMADTGYIDDLFESPRDLGFDNRGKTRLEYSLKTCREIDGLLRHSHTFLPGIGEYFNEEVEQGFSRAAALRLAAFLSGISAETGNEQKGPRSGCIESPGHTDPAEEFCRRLSVSCRTIRVVNNTIAGSRRVLDLTDIQHITGKDMHRLFRSYPECVPEMLLLAMVSSKATVHAIQNNDASASLEARIAYFWSYYRERYLLQKETPLISGRDIMNAFSLNQGPMIGECLKRVEEARSDGAIRTRDEALEYVRTIISTFTPS